MIRQFLEGILGSSSEKNKGNLAFHCPFCHHRKKKLEIQPEMQYWNCWVCNTKGKSLYSLLKRIDAKPGQFQKLQELLPKDDRTNYLIRNRNKDKNKPIVRLPQEFISLAEEKTDFFYTTARKYLTNQRKCTDLDICKYNIGYTNHGPFKDMLVFPNYNEYGDLDFFTTRSYMNGSSKKFINPSFDKDVIGFELQLNWNLPLLVCESALDAITLRINSSPMYGKTMSKKLKIAILENEVSDIYLCLDPDAFKQSITYIKYLINFGINVYNVQFPTGTDVNKLGYENSWEIITNTKKMTEGTLFDLEILNKLEGI